MAASSLEHITVIEPPRDQREFTTQEWQTLYNILQQQGRPLIDLLRVAEELGI